jgi:hypothetical protein
VKSLSIMVLANRIVACGRQCSCKRHSVIEEILTCVIARHRRTLTGAKWEEGKKERDPLYCSWLYITTSQGSCGVGAPPLQYEQGGWPGFERDVETSPSLP